jgi:hypothetical protein
MENKSVEWATCACGGLFFEDVIDNESEEKFIVCLTCNKKWRYRYLEAKGRAILMAPGSYLEEV